MNSRSGHTHPRARQADRPLWSYAISRLTLPVHYEVTVWSQLSGPRYYTAFETWNGARQAVFSIYALKRKGPGDDRSL